MRGKYGAPMNSIEHIGKPKPIPCDCARCYYSERSYWGSLYCTFYGKHDPNKTSCARYWCTKPPQKSKKSKKKKKDTHKKK